MENRTLIACLVAFVLVCSVRAEGMTRRALLVGIDDYLGSPPSASPPRGLTNLGGPVHDVAAMREALTGVFGFSRRDVVTLLDRAATRDAILASLAQLETHTERDDIVLFYFGGHGSQAVNSRSDEPDRLDETIVPADARFGVRDIRDKELRTAFNRILDRGARLTIVLDSCHSGSGARGIVTGAVWRGVDPDPRDVADASPAGPKPEDRGALVFSASTDRGLAFETTDEKGEPHGAFSLALLQAIREQPDQPAIELFLRVRARLSAAHLFQIPVIAGNPAARQTPFLHSRNEQSAPRSVIAVESVRADGRIVLRGGWLNGIDRGAELRPVEKNDSGVRLEVSALIGLTHCEARRTKTSAHRAAPKTGTLFEVASWAAPAGHRLRVWMPAVSSDAAALRAAASALEAETKRRGIGWITDPSVMTPTHLLRRGNGAWQLVECRSGRAQTFDSPADALRSSRAGAALFVQFPAPAAMVNEIIDGAGGERSVIEPVASAEDADYLLAGRWSGGELEYAWVRPFTIAADETDSALPLVTSWQPAGSRRTPFALTDAVLRLRKIQAWLLAESPHGSAFSYRLAIRSARDGKLAGSSLTGNDLHGIVLQSKVAPVAPVHARYVYVFVIDRMGRSTLLYPRGGSVENYFPLDGAPPAVSIDVGPRELFRVTAPYGADMYFLLTTDEPLDDPWVLEWDGVGARSASARSAGTASPLAELLADLNGRERGIRAFRIPNDWSIESVVFQAIPPWRLR